MLLLLPCITLEFHFFPKIRFFVFFYYLSFLILLLNISTLLLISQATTHCWCYFWMTLLKVLLIHMHNKSFFPRVVFLQQVSCIFCYCSDYLFFFCDQIHFFHADLFFKHIFFIVSFLWSPVVKQVIPTFILSYPYAILLSHLFQAPHRVYFP